jgi:hypothetical protein
MKKYHSIFFAVALAGCSMMQVPIAPSSATLGLGETTEAHLTERYNDTRVNCGATTQPAFLCNGVLIRGTNFSTAYHSWDNSPDNHRTGGVSFSFLRRDSRFNKLAYYYDNGYIFLPVFYADGKATPEILCAFPIDGATAFRANGGCGAVSGVPRSAPCQSQGIYTPTAWLNHYRTGPRNHQCGFDVRDALDTGATTAFDAMIKSMALLGSESFGAQNELRMAVWPDGSGNYLPMEAFFYINNSAAGRKDAQDDQRDFKNTTGRTVPVISLWLPQASTSEATFKYLVSDQVVPVP